MVDTAQIIKKAVESAHITGVQALSKEQFDALFLSARGMGAVKQKYHDDPLGLQAGLMQEDIFELIGIPLDTEYLKQKKALQKKYFADKDNLSANKLAKKEKEYLAAIETLRNEFKVDAFIGERVQAMVNNPSQYARQRDEFSMRLSMDFIEDDMDVKVKKPHESDAEFALKQKINFLIHGKAGEPSKYSLLRKNYLLAKQKIESKYQEDLAEIRREIDEPVAEITSQAEPALAENRQKQQALSDYFPVTAIKENNGLRLLTAQREYARANEKWRSKQTPALKAEMDRLGVEIAALTVLRKKQDQYDAMSPEVRVQAIRAELSDKLEEEQKQLISAKQQAIMACEAPIQEALQALEEKRVKDLAKCKREHASELKIADKYFDENILPLVQELKTQEAHKYFVVLSKKMKAILVDNVAELEQVDSNTVGFVGLFNKLISDLTIIGAVQHIGVKTAEDFMDKQVGSSKTTDDSMVQGLLEGAAAKASKKIGKALGESVGAKSAFTEHVAHMEQYARLQVPQPLAGEFDADSFTTFLPETQAVTTPKTEQGRHSESIFDVIEQFNQSKGVLDKLDTAKSVYKAITTAKPGSTFFSETPENNAQVFVKALEDEALAFNYRMLEQFSAAIDTLDNHKALASLANKEEWVALSTKAKALQDDKDSLDKEFQALLDLHEQKREAYKQAQKPFKVAKQTLDDYVKERQRLAEKLAIEKDNAIQAKEALYDAKLPPEKRAEIKAGLAALEENYQVIFQGNDQWYSRNLRTLKSKHEARLVEADQEHEKQLVAYDKETKKGIVNILERAYAQEKTFNIGILASKSDLKKYRKRHPEIEAVIKKYRQDRENGKSALADGREAAKASSAQQLETDISALVKKYGKKKLDAQEDKVKAANKILSAQTKVDKGVEKIERKHKKLEAELAALDEKIEAHKVQVDQREQVLVGISRDFYTAVHAFNEHKSQLNKGAQELLGQAFKLESNGEPHLRALQTMFAGAHKKMEAIALASEKLLPTIVEGVSTQMMSYDDVVSKVMGRREVKEVMQTADEQSMTDKAAGNLIQFGAKSIVEGVSGQAVKVAVAFVDGLGHTLQAEQAFSERQSQVNERAAVLGLNLEEQKPEPREVILDPKKEGFLSSIFKAIGGVFKSIKNAFVGSNQERKKERARFDDVAVEDIEVTTPVVEPKKRQTLTFAAQQFADRSRELAAQQSGKKRAEALVQQSTGPADSGPIPKEQQGKKSARRKGGRG